MSTRSQQLSGAKENQTRATWYDAIADAKERIRRLRYSILVFEARKKAGESWPGTPATQN
jgi:hypothetical protein